jgi:hypothetical protein
VIATLEQHYPNVSLVAGGSYHQLMVQVYGTQTDGKTTTAWCVHKTWTYLATVTGPQFLSPSPTAKC